MHPLAETLLDEPVIAAVKTDEALTAAGQSRRHGRHARRCRRSFHLCALPVGYLSQNKIPAEVRKA